MGKNTPSCELLSRMYYLLKLGVKATLLVDRGVEICGGVGKQDFIRHIQSLDCVLCYLRFGHEPFGSRALIFEFFNDYQKIYIYLSASIL